MSYMRNAEFSRSCGLPPMRACRASTATYGDCDWYDYNAASFDGTGAQAWSHGCRRFGRRGLGGSRGGAPQRSGGQARRAADSRRQARRSNSETEGATRRLEQARESLAANTQRLADAEAAEAKASEDVRRVQAELAQPPPADAPPDLLCGVRKLLEVLEQRAGGLPEKVVDSMAQLHVLAGTADEAEAEAADMRLDLCAAGREDTAVAPADLDLTSLGVAELEKRLEELHKQHMAALATKQWAMAASLGATLNRLTDAFQAAASSGRA